MEYTLQPYSDDYADSCSSHHGTELVVFASTIHDVLVNIWHHLISTWITEQNLVSVSIRSNSIEVSNSWYVLLTRRKPLSKAGAVRRPRGLALQLDFLIHQTISSKLVQMLICNVTAQFRYLDTLMQSARSTTPRWYTLNCLLVAGVPESTRYSSSQRKSNNHLGQISSAERVRTSRNI